jgi:hypothetical protein
MKTEDDPVPVGPTVDVVLDGVAYGAEDDATIPMVEPVDDSELAGGEYSGILKLDVVKDKLPVPVGPDVELELLFVGYGELGAVPTLVAVPMLEIVEEL